MKTMRAWSGKLNRINDFVNFLDNNEMLNKTESNEKAKAQHRYYRLYNDGDMPHGMKYESYSHVQAVVEANLETILKRILKKYNCTESRTAVRKAKIVDIIKTVIISAEANDPSMVEHFYKQLPDSIKTKIHTPMISAMHYYRDLDNMSKNACNNCQWEKSYHNPNSKIITFRRDIMMSDGIWNDLMEDMIINMVGEFAKLAFILKQYVK